MISASKKSNGVAVSGDCGRVQAVESGISNQIFELIPIQIIQIAEILLANQGNESTILMSQLLLNVSMDYIKYQ